MSHRLIEKALAEGRNVLDEFESKELLRSYGIPAVPETACETADQAVAACTKLGFPVVMKALSSKIAHKTERGLVKIGIKDAGEAAAAFKELREGSGADFERVLVQKMVNGRRELVAGLSTDAQFGPVVMFGLGGIFTEILKDVSFRVAPITTADALEMMDEIRAKKILVKVRGMPEADRSALAGLLVATGKIGVENPEVREIDMNPVMLEGSSPVVVDALVVLKNRAS
jgi:acetyl-CoA synthetase (ADP-forming)